MFCEYFSQLFQIFLALLCAGTLTILPFWIVYKFIKAVFQEATKQRRK